MSKCAVMRVGMHNSFTRIQLMKSTQQDNKLGMKLNEILLFNVPQIT